MPPPAVATCADSPCPSTARVRAAANTDRRWWAVAELAVGSIGSSHLGLIRPEIERLALNHGMLIALWRITDDGHIVVLDRAFGADMVRVDMRVGSRLP